MINQKLIKLFEKYKKILYRYVLPTIMFVFLLAVPLIIDIEKHRYISWFVLFFRLIFFCGLVQGYYFFSDIGGSINNFYNGTKFEDRPVGKFHQVLNIVAAIFCGFTWFFVTYWIFGFLYSNLNYLKMGLSILNGIVAIPPLLCRYNKRFYQ